MGTRLAYLVALAALGLLLTVAWEPAPAAVTGAPLAQATATPTPTPLAAPGWDRTDHPDNVRCYTAYWNGAPYGGCVVVSP
jgi:hypothetical protein